MSAGTGRWAEGTFWDEGLTLKLNYANSCTTI